MNYDSLNFPRPLFQKGADNASFGFIVSRYGLDYIITDTKKLGINRGYIGEVWRRPLITKVIYWVNMKAQILIETDYESHKKFEPIAPELLEKLEEIRGNYISNGYTVTPLRRLPCCGNKSPPYTKYESVDIKYNTDSEEECAL